MRSTFFTAALFTVAMQSSANAVELTNDNQLELAQLVSESYGMEQLSEMALSQLYDEVLDIDDGTENIDSGNESTDGEVADNTELEAQMKAKGRGKSDKQAKNEGAAQKATFQYVNSVLSHATVVPTDTSHDIKRKNGQLKALAKTI